jgi:peroxiredoxin
VDEWNLPTEPWTFVVDKEGRISAKFEQFTTGEEIEKALNELL